MVRPVTDDLSPAVDDLHVKAQGIDQKLEKGHAPPGRFQEGQTEVWAGDFERHPWEPGAGPHIHDPQPWGGRNNRQTGQGVEEMQPDDVFWREDPRQIQAPGPDAEGDSMGFELG